MRIELCCRTSIHIKDSIIYYNLLRLKRICTRNTDFNEHSKELTTHLLNKAYPIEVIMKQWNKVINKPCAKITYKRNVTDLFTHLSLPGIEPKLTSYDAGAPAT